MDNYIKKYMIYYANLFDKEIGTIIKSESVSSEQQAKKILSFIDFLCRQSQIDFDLNKSVLGHEACSYTTKTACLTIIHFLENTGYSYLLEQEW